MSASSIFAHRPVWKRHPDDAILFELDDSDEQGDPEPRPIKFTERAQRAQEAVCSLFRYPMTFPSSSVAVEMAEALPYLRACQRQLSHVPSQVRPRYTAYRVGMGIQNGLSEGICGEEPCRVRIAI